MYFVPSIFEDFRMVWSKLQVLNHLLHITDLFECYCWQNYTTVSNTDLFLSYVFPEHNDSVERGLTVLKITISLKIVGVHCAPMLSNVTRPLTFIHF